MNAKSYPLRIQVCKIFVGMGKIDSRCMGNFSLARRKESVKRITVESDTSGGRNIFDFSQSDVLEGE